MLIRLLLLILIGTFSLTGCAATKAGAPQAGTSLAATPQTNDSSSQKDEEFLNTGSSKAFDSDFDADFDDWDAPVKLIADPFEPINRGVFWVNDKLYFYLFKPLARGYGAIVPRPARVSVSNFFSNVSTPVRVANALLQFNLTNVGTETYRFIVNSTIGLVGLFDPATSVAEVRRAPADFGQTLGKYGFGHGFYLILPIVGPSSVRDGTGTFVDSFADPFRYAGLATEDLVLIRVFDSTNRLSLDRDTYEGIKRDALDPYVFIRTAYAQRRLAQIGDPVYNLNILQAPIFDSELFNPLEWFNLWP